MRCRLSSIVYRQKQKRLGYCLSKHTLRLEPFAEAVDPVIGWQALPMHAKAMPTLGVDMQLGRSAGDAPGGIQWHAGTHGKRVIVGHNDEQRRGIGRYADILERRAIDRRREIRPATRIV